MTVRQTFDENPDGAYVGKSATSLVGFWGATPVVQPTSASQAAVTITAVTAIGTTASTTTTPYGFATSTQFNSLVTAVNEAIVDVGALGTLVNQIRSDLVTAGVLKGS